MGWASATPPGRAGIAKSPPESVAARPSWLVRCAAARGCRRPGRTAAVTAKGGLPDVSALRALAASVRLALAGAGVNPALAERVGAWFIDADPVTAAERLAAESHGDGTLSARAYA